MTGTAARIVVVEDRVPDRSYLATLLRYHGYQVIEAIDGEEGLSAAAEHSPDLVISDMLMPRMDGYEFVRRLRRTASGADVPVIFYTATYSEREARLLAEECGVVEVLLKPSQPEAMLAKVAAILARGRLRVAPIADELFERAHLRLTNAKLIEKVRDLEASERRMAAIVEVGHRFIEEREPITLLNRVCVSVRETTLAAYSIVGLFAGDFSQLSLVLTSGHDERTTEFLRAAGHVSPVVRQMASDRRPVRLHNLSGDGGVMGLPEWHGPVGSLMLVPLASRGRVYGFFCVLQKDGGGEFSEADEQLAVALGVQAGIAYENAILINELEAQAKRLRDSQETTDFALGTAGIGIAERDLTSDDIRLSNAAADLFDLPQGCRLTREAMCAHIHPNDREAMRRELDAPLEPGHSDHRFDARVVNAAGAIRSLHGRGFFLRDTSGRPRRRISVLIDLTERRQLEAQLRQAQKIEAIGQLAGGVAHDFNNLLTVILTYAQFLMPTLSADSHRSDLKEIINAADRAAALTRQLLGFSRQQVHQPGMVDVNQLIDDIADMLQRLIGESVTLESSLASGLAPIEADHGQLELVVMNLVINARDAMPSGGMVRLQTANVTGDEGDRVRLTVTDSGTGMTQETMARLFEPFFTTKEVGKGTGLGLATVSGIVAQSGGRITVDSVLGRGSVFSIDFPRAAGIVACPTPTVASAVNGSESVLLVEDERAVRLLVRSILERAGYRVAEASHVQEALRVAEAAGHIDLLITDVVMPGGSGPELFRQLAIRLPQLRVMYMSGYAKETILDTRELEHRAAFVPKPFTPQLLTHNVRGLLDRVI